MRTLRSMRSLSRKLGKQMTATVDLRQPHPEVEAAAEAKRERRRQRNLGWVASGGVLRMGE